MADDTFQNQVCLDDATFVPYPDEAMIFDLGTNTMVDQPVDAIPNRVWPDSVAWDAYFDDQMSLNLAMDDTTANDASDNVWPSSVACEFYLDEQMAPNTVGDETFHDPGHITFDSYIDGPLTIDLATNPIGDDIFDIDYMTGDLHFDEPETKEFERWKESWNEKMLLVSWKREGKEWNDIAKDFRKLGTPKGIGGWKTTLKRASSEVEALGKAIIADRKGEADRLGGLALYHPLGDAVQVDYDGLWARIAESIKTYGSERKWSSDKVKYAWDHGVSGLFPHIQLRQRKVLSACLM